MPSPSIYFAYSSTGTVPLVSQLKKASVGILYPERSLDLQDIPKGQRPISMQLRRLSSEMPRYLLLPERGCKWDVPHTGQSVLSYACLLLLVLIIATKRTHGHDLTQFQELGQGDIVGRDLRQVI